MARPKVHDEALRVRLLEQAVRTLSEEGPDALSLRKLAAQVGTSTTAVYSLFGGKPALLGAVYDEAFERFGRRLATIPPGDDPLADLAALGVVYRQSALADPHFYQVMFGPAGGSFTPGPESRTRAEATFRPLLDAVRRAIDAGVFRDEDPAVIAGSLWASVHGFVSLELRSLLPPTEDGPDELYRKAMVASSAGWLTADARARA
ncbi:TetR/AcrR family transcriptional regulator [Pseudonocardia acaciae]|uniref:TetR/AcrR family transcriptional regulator n=1 Tax=Pseudonocardia acaciae TaxID=551276 RepID=UPI00048F48F4|nr:TetR-like C-terminal domain-containing protein [Pseudonocardia acaciae]